MDNSSKDQMAVSDSSVDVNDLPDRVSEWLEGLRATVRQSRARDLFEVQIGRAEKIRLDGEDRVLFHEAQAQ